MKSIYIFKNMYKVPGTTALLYITYQKQEIWMQNDSK